jgi:hypothetical protein
VICIRDRQSETHLALPFFRLENAAWQKPTYPDRKRLSGYVAAGDWDFMGECRTWMVPREGIAPCVTSRTSQLSSA